nr:hypothetical protein [Syntrophaceae bacterium]
MAGKNGNLQRWLTGLVLAVILLAIIFFGSVEILAAVIALAIVVAVWEYNSIVFGKGFLKEKIESMIFAALIPAVALAGSAEMMIAFLAFATMVVFMVFLWRVDESTFDLSSVLKVVFGMVYLPLLT